MTAFIPCLQATEGLCLIHTYYRLLQHSLIHLSLANVHRLLPCNGSLSSLNFRVPRRWFPLAAVSWSLPGCSLPALGFSALSLAVEPGPKFSLLSHRRSDGKSLVVSNSHLWPKKRFLLL
jgi:hypothetical protein